MPPYRGKCSAGQNVDRILAKAAAVPAHLDAEATDFMMAGGIEQARQHNQHCCKKYIGRPPNGLLR